MKIGFTFLDLWYFMDYTDWIKPHLFFFDSLIVDRNNIEMIEKLILPGDKSKTLFKKKILEIELLESRGLIQIFDNDSFKLLPNFAEDSAIYDNLQQHIKGYKNIVDFNKSTELRDFYSFFMENDREAGQYGVRYKSAAMNRTNLVDEYIPIIKKLYYSDNKVSKENVLHIAFNKFPFINDNVGIETLLEIRDDADIQMRYYQLRDFVTDISKSQLTLKEIEDKIEYLLHEYKVSLKLHNLKYSSGVLETICITTSEFLEDILKFKFSDALKLLFELKKKNIEVVEAEKSLPGRELSYLHFLNQRTSVVTKSL